MQTFKRVLLTGGAGFIGSHLAEQLLTEGWHVTAVDNFDSFYDRSVKWQNIQTQLQDENYKLVQADICDLKRLQDLTNGRYDVIIHLAAKAGVRPSLLDPIGYQQVNVVGTQNMLELAKTLQVQQFIFASSSSVYGMNPNVPWREDDHTLQPISPYASTKVSGELLGHVYSHLYGIRFIALRFFTVYGPRQRPDLAIHKMARLIMNDDRVPIFGNGNSRRDYTYIDDIIKGILGAIEYRATKFEVINLGGSNTISLLALIRILEKVSGCKARLEFHPEQPGDVPQTYADITKARALLGYEPRTAFSIGIQNFFGWLQSDISIKARAHFA